MRAKKIGEQGPISDEDIRKYTSNPSEQQSEKIKMTRLMGEAGSLTEEDIDKFGRK